MCEACNICQRETGKGCSSCLPTHSATAGGSRNRFVYASATISAIGGLLFGFDTGIISGALLFIREDLGLSEFLQASVVSAVLVGAIVGAGTGGYLADRFGRRWMTIVAAIVFIVGAVGSAFAPTVWLLIVAPGRARPRRWLLDDLRAALHRRDRTRRSTRR